MQEDEKKILHAEVLSSQKKGNLEVIGRRKSAYSR